jgi:hypothetical protein
MPSASLPPATACGPPSERRVCVGDELTPPTCSTTEGYMHLLYHRGLHAPHMLYHRGLHALALPPRATCTPPKRGRCPSFKGQTLSLSVPPCHPNTRAIRTLSPPQHAATSTAIASSVWPMDSGSLALICATARPRQSGGEAATFSGYAAGTRQLHSGGWRRGKISQVTQARG